MVDYNLTPTCLFLSSVLMLGIQPVLFAEALGIVADTEEFFVYYSIRNDSIDNLMVDRSNLEVNFEENREEIERIDYKLDQLGVDVLSETEVASKLGVVSPNMDTPTIDGVRWTNNPFNHLHRITFSFLSSKSQI